MTFFLITIMLYLLPGTLSGLLRDIIDLLVPGLIQFFPALYLDQQDTEFGASKVHN